MALFLSVGTLYHYEISFADSVRLTLQYKTAKLHVHSFMHSTKVKQNAYNFYNLLLTATLTLLLHQRHAPRRPYSGSARQLELHTELSEIAHGHLE